jgi:hypothetical protein
MGYSPSYSCFCDFLGNSLVPFSHRPTASGSYVSAFEWLSIGFYLDAAREMTGKHWDSPIEHSFTKPYGDLASKKW